MTSLGQNSETEIQIGPLTGLAVTDCEQNFEHQVYDQTNQSITQPGNAALHEKKKQKKLSDLMVTLRKQSNSWITFLLEVQLSVNKKYF